MTDEDKKRIFEYMGWCYHKYAKSGKLWGTGICIRCKDPLPKEHPLDGNDMVAAMNKMAENKELWGLDSFLDYADEQFDKAPEIDDDNFIHWLMQPARFFDLMVEWRKEQK